jgi:integrase/recombinase XerD
MGEQQGTGTDVAVSPSVERVPFGGDDAPTLLAWAGERGVARTLEFLTATIRNPHTRRAYHRAAARFASWCAMNALPLRAVRSPHVAAYIEGLGAELSPLSVKQHLAALKHWFDFLVLDHVLEHNPATPVRGPRYRQDTGKTPVLERDEARRLLNSIDGAAVIDARDKALIAVMLSSFARVGAVVKMRVRDYRGAGTSSAMFTLHEKSGKFHRVPAHHMAASLLDAYVGLSGLAASPEAPLWQGSSGRTGKLSGEPLTERGALDIVKRRCRAAELPEDICSHSFRATGITLHQDAGGDLEAARQIAGHANIKTTQLYNRSGDRKRRNEVERAQL